MKRYIVPAFFIVDAPCKDTADQVVCDIQDIQNFGGGKNGAALFIDEGIPTIQMPDSWETLHTIHDVIKLVMEKAVHE